MTHTPALPPPALPEIPRRHLMIAEGLARQLPDALKRRSLEPAFSGCYVSRVQDMTFFIAVLDPSRLGDQKRYTGDIVHQLSTELGGKPVYLSNTTGIRYVVLLSPPPKLPHKIDMPGDVPSGKVALGMRYTGEHIVASWEKIPHMAVLGMTGSGKSTFLRSLVYQALRDDMRLLLSDIDQTTFGMLENHPALLAPLATTPDATAELVRRALAECEHRKTLFTAMAGAPEKLSEYNGIAAQNGKPILPRVLVVLDEASAVLSSMGGSRGELGKMMATLGYRGRKFGVHFVFGAQEFTKDLNGPVREQVALSICFKVRHSEMANRMGCTGAHRIPESRTGLCITDRFGPMQAYFVEKQLLMGDGPIAIRSVLTDQEKMLFGRAMQETDGKLPLSKIMEWAGVGKSTAARRQEGWTLRGLLEKVATRDNAFCLTARAISLLESGNRETGETHASPLKPAGEPPAAEEPQA